MVTFILITALLLKAVVYFMQQVMACGCTGEENIKVSRSVIRGISQCSRNRKRILPLCSTKKARQHTDLLHLCTHHSTKWTLVHDSTQRNGMLFQSVCHHLLHKLYLIMITICRYFYAYWLSTRKTQVSDTDWRNCAVKKVVPNIQNL